MGKYISKTALVVEIEKELNTTRKYSTEYVNGKKYALKKILSFIDTLEMIEIGVDLGDPKGDKSAKYIIDTKNLDVKEVDLEKHLKEDIEDAVHGTVDYPLIGCDFPNIFPNYKELKEYCDRNGIKDNDKVKLIIIKDV